MPFNLWIPILEALRISSMASQPEPWDLVGCSNGGPPICRF